MTGGHIPEEIIDRIRLQTDLVEIISAQITLKRTGKNYVGLCPFHAEKTPSFSVNVEKQIFHCFGCGTGGNVFTFLMKMEGLSFPEAVRKMGATAGIAIPEPIHREASERESREKQRLFEANEEAERIYRRQLWENAEADQARSYLSGRGLARETIERFRLGYALPAWDGLIRALAPRYTPELLERAGLAVPREGGRGCYDRFRGRIVFPIHDLQGRVIAFGGRVLDQTVPKYLNSPESPVFSKGHHLFALESARDGIRRAGFVIVVEGYFDVIALHQAGFENTVGTLGTALTSEHVAQIRRFTPRVVLMFDPDDAGVRASRRALDLFVGSGLRVDAVDLPRGDDPDTCVRKEGPQAFGERIRSAVPLMEFSIRRSVAGLSPQAPVESRVTVLEEYFPVIARMGNRVEMSHYLRRLSELLGVDEKSVSSEFRARHRVRRTDRTAPPERLPEAPAEEETLVHLALHGHADPVQIERLGMSSFSDERCRAILETLWKSGWQVADHSTLFTAVESVPGAKDLVARLSMREIRYDDVSRTASDCVVAVLQKRLRRGMEALDKDIRAAEAAGDSEKISSLQAKKVGLKKESIRGALN